MATPEKIQAALNDISVQIKAQAQAAEREMKAHAQLTEETRASVDKLLTAQGELQARLSAAEQMVAKLETGTGGVFANHTIGEQVINSDKFQQYAATGQGNFSMRLNASIGSGSGSAGDLVVPDRVPGIIMPMQQRLTIRDLISWGRTGSNSIEYARELVYTNAADVVSENPSAGKPESDLTFEADAAPIVTVAHWIHASAQILADVPQLMSYIDGRLRYGLKLKEETQLLKGSGQGLNINGILTQADSFNFSGISVQAETRTDRLRLALLQAELSHYSADAIVLSPVDWAAIELTKDNNNNYMFTNARSTMAPGLWGRNVVATPAMDSGDYLVGVFGGGLAVQGWDREDINVMISLEDRDNFIKNMATIRCEERVGLTVYRPSAFVAGDFSDLDPSS